MSNLFRASINELDRFLAGSRDGTKSITNNDDKKMIEEGRDSFSIDKREEKRRSKYDLPLQYYDDALKQLKPNNLLYQKMDMEDSTRLSVRNLKADVLQTIISNKPKYQFVSEIALRKLKSDTVKQLRILCNHEFCDSVKPWPMNDMPRQLFYWSREDFLERRSFTNSVWIDILIRDRSQNCLYFYKYRTDTEELIKYLNLILDSFLTKTQQTNFANDVLNAIRDVCEFTHIFNDLIKEFSQQEFLFQEECNKILALNFRKRNSKTKYKQLLEEQLMNLQYVLPIETRCQLRYYDNKAEQSEMKNDIIEKGILKQISDLKMQIQREHYCSECACNSIYINVENFKSRISVLTEKYDREYEAIDNKIQVARLSIEKISDQRKFMEEQIERFHEEIEIMEARSIAEKAEEERLVMERLASELRAKEAKERKSSKNLKKKPKK